MKKQFFYAALAIAMMSSCSSNDTPGAQEPNSPDTPDVEDKVAIQIGVGAPASVEVATKGGAVGAVGDAENKWAGQKLIVKMFGYTGYTEDQLEAKDGSTKILDNTSLQFVAPSDEASGIIRMTATGTSPYSYRYYPSTGRYAFYGCHLDDAVIDNWDSDDEHKVTFTIDGTQDIMSATTATLGEENTTDNSKPYYHTTPVASGEWALMPNRTFSAWSARRGIQPYLEFKHQLARLTFEVEAGDKTAAAYNYNSGTLTWEENKNSEGNNLGVKITSITVQGMDEKLDLTLNGGSTPLEKNTGSSGTAEFALTQDGETTLTETAPSAYGNEGLDNDHTATTKVGESIMFLPVANGDTGTDKQITLKIGLSQLVPTEYTIDGGGNEVGQTYQTKSEDLLYTLKTSDVDAFAAFEVGKSYKIVIKVYSFQKIEVSASLAAWTDGGTANIAPGDQF